MCVPEGMCIHVNVCAWVCVPVLINAFVCMGVCALSVCACEYLCVCVCVSPHIQWNTTQASKRRK